MSSTQPESSRSDSAGFEGTVAGPGADGPRSDHSDRRVLMSALAAGIVGGCLAWLNVEGVLRLYRNSLMPAMKPFPTPDDIAKGVNARVESGSLAFGLMGALLGLSFGVAGGTARRSIGAAFASASSGLLLGAVAAGATSWFVLPRIYVDMDPQSHDLLLPLLCHSAVWSVAGAAGGLAFGLGIGGRNRWARTAFGGLVGAAAAALVYELAGALAFPSHSTHLPVSSSPETRAMAQILVGLGTAVGSALTARDPKPGNKPTA